MPERSENQTKNPLGVRRSLNRKTFIITLILTLCIGVTVLIAGFALYLKGVTHEYYVSTWNQANAEAAVLEQTNYRSICDEILRIYDSIPEEERGDGQSPEYLEKFESVRTDDFVKVQEAMHSLQSRNGPMNAFIVALDEENDRMIYLIDADMAATHCPEGSWDIYPHDQIATLIHGEELSDLDVRIGIKNSIQAVRTDLVRFGPRCTAGSTLFETDRYTVMVCVDEKLEPVIETGKYFLARYIVLLVVITLIASWIGMMIMRKALVKPINRMAKAAMAYGQAQEKQAGLKYFDELNINTGDELQHLAGTLQRMEEDVADYMDNLTTVTAEKERINTELTLAARIQQSMLTVVFPPFPERSEFDIYASMEPAKEVGGDFYDMILVDDDHLAIEIADVSGKGVPAALFMMASKIMLADGLRESLSPAEILEQVNTKICDRNQEEMFVTVWLGVLEISTGKLTAANAGHEYPVMIHPDGTVEMIRDKHGFVIGGLEGMKYKEYELQMNKGDKIFVYTDGVTEATSEANELFGLQRTMEAAGTAPKGADPQQVLQQVREAVSDFVGAAEQFDDLTMLCMEWRG